MALIVEDGTGVVGANSYADLTYLRDFAVVRGAALSNDDAAVEAQAIRAMDYLEGQGLGLLTVTWPLPYGRLCSLSAEAALVRLAAAQAALCIEQQNGVDLAPARTSDFITEETVGPITTKYSDKFGPTAGLPPAMPAVMVWLRPLLCGHGAFGLRTVRV